MGGLYYSPSWLLSYSLAAEFNAHGQEVAVTFSNEKAVLHLCPIDSGCVGVHVVTSVHLSLPSLTGVGPRAAC